MNKRLLVFTVLLTVTLSFIALRGRQHRAPVSSTGPATTALSANSESQKSVPAAKGSPEEVTSGISGDVRNGPSRVDGSSNLSETETPPPGNVPNPAVSVQQPTPILGRTAPPPLRRLVVTFDDIPCPGHIRTIIDAMARVQGVSDVSIFYDESRGEIDYDPALATPDAIVNGMPPDCPARILEDRPGT